MDDFLKTYSFIKYLTGVTRSVTQNLKNAGFRLAKFTSNTQDVIDQLPSSKIVKQSSISQHMQTIVIVQSQQFCLSQRKTQNTQLNLILIHTVRNSSVSFVGTKHGVRTKNYRVQPRNGKVSYIYLTLLPYHDFIISKTRQQQSFIFSLMHLVQLMVQSLIIELFKNLILSFIHYYKIPFSTVKSKILHYS